MKRNKWTSFWRDTEGAATAEYAIATMAAVGLAGLLVGILKGGAVQQILTNLITGAPLWGAVFVVGRIAGFEPRRGELGPRLKAKHRFAAGDPHSPRSTKVDVH